MCTILVFWLLFIMTACLLFKMNIACFQNLRINSFEAKSNYPTLSSRAPPFIEQRWNAFCTLSLSNPKTMMVFWHSFLRISASCSTALIVENFGSIFINNTLFPRLRTSFVLKSFGGYLKILVSIQVYSDLRMGTTIC